jgi:hypothetical protein
MLCQCGVPTHSSNPLSWRSARIAFGSNLRMLVPRRPLHFSTCARCNVNIIMCTSPVLIASLKIFATCGRVACFRCVVSLGGTHTFGVFRCGTPFSLKMLSMTKARSASAKVEYLPLGRSHCAKWCLAKRLLWRSARLGRRASGTE